MLTWKNLHPEICSFKNLVSAEKRARRGKRCRPEVFQFQLRLEENLCGLQHELETLSWVPGPYRDFSALEAKRRLISAAPYRDRVVHHALCGQKLVAFVDTEN